MSRLIILTLNFIVILSNNIQCQNFDALTSQIFFGVDIKKHDTAILSDFKLKPELTLKKDSGWTMYPPTDDQRNPIPFYRFTFSTHPYFIAGLNTGVLMVMTNKESNRIIGMSLSFSLKSAQAFDSTYKNTTRLYSEYASRTIKRPNIVQPFEVTKYISKDGHDYIIITKGESDNKPYIHIAYNFQDYDW